MTNVSFNGKFLSASPTGVHRVAEELIVALGQLMARDEGLANAFQGEVLAPKSANRELEGTPFAHRTVGALTWQPWEQFELPLYARKKLLVSLCNLSPVSVKHGITMIHDAQVFITPESYSRAFRSWYQFALPQIGKRQHKVLTVSNFSKGELAKWKIAPERKIEVIHNGVDHVLRTEADYAVLKKFGLTSGSFSVGLANTQAHKNLKVAIEAHARPELAERKLVLFGSATKEKFEVEGIDVPSNVIFAGFVSEGELRALLETANAMVFPSLTEGFGLPPLEAMQLGTPAICAPCGALPEVCGDAALYADPHDAEAWARAVLTLAGESENVRRDSCLAQAEKFTWDAAARRLADVMVECLERGSAQG